MVYVDHHHYTPLAPWVDRECDFLAPSKINFAGEPPSLNQALASRVEAKVVSSIHYTIHRHSLISFVIIEEGPKLKSKRAHSIVRAKSRLSKRFCKAIENFQKKKS